MRTPLPLMLPGEGGSSGSAALRLRRVQARSLEKMFPGITVICPNARTPSFSLYESCGCEVACVSGIQLNLLRDHLFDSPARVKPKLF